MRFGRQRRTTLTDAAPRRDAEPARDGSDRPSDHSDATPVRLVEIDDDGESTRAREPEPPEQSAPVATDPQGTWPARATPQADSGTGRVAFLVNPAGTKAPAMEGELDVIGPRVDKVLAFAREEATGAIERARALAAEIVAGARVQADAIVEAARQERPKTVDGRARAERMESARLLRSARADAEEILRKARAEAKAEVLRARDEADDIVAQALHSPGVTAVSGEVEAAQVLAAARSEADTLLAEARSQIAEHVERARATLAAERAAVLAQIDQLEAKRDAMRADVRRLTEVLAPVLTAARLSTPATPPGIGQP